MRKLIYTTITVIVISLLGGMLYGQISSKYAFTQSSSVWEAVWGNYVTGAMTDEGLSTPVDIGFTFPYGNNNYTVAKLSSNGWLGLGTSLNSAYWNNDLTISPLIAPLWDDLDITYGAVQYNSFGLPPHRMFVAQWLAVKWNAYGMNEYNFMTRLHETGQVDFIYGPHDGAPNNPSASIGMSIAPGGTGNYLSVLPGIPAQVSSSTQYQNLQTPLESGMMYIFMPKTLISANVAAVNLSGPKNPMQNVASNYTITVGNAGTGLITNGTTTAYLMRDEEVLLETTMAAIVAGGFSSKVVSWTPDTTGLMQLYVKIVHSADPDSLNNVTFPYTVSVQPYVSNDDEFAVMPDLKMDVYPNPFQEKVNISFELKSTETTYLKIYNLKGQKVFDLLDGKHGIGLHTAVWNGKDTSGKAVPNGVYFAKLNSGNRSVTSKLIMLR
jgi:hypothetical protein